MTQELCTLANGRVVIVLEVSNSSVVEMYPADRACDREDMT